MDRELTGASGASGTSSARAGTLYGLTAYLIVIIAAITMGYIFFY